MQNLSSISVRLRRRCSENRHERVHGVSLSFKVSNNHEDCSRRIHWSLIQTTPPTTFTHCTFYLSSDLSERHPVTSVLMTEDSSQRQCAGSPTQLFYSTKWRKLILTCSTSYCSFSMMADSQTPRGTSLTSGTRSSSSPQISEVKKSCTLTRATKRQ